MSCHDLQACDGEELREFLFPFSDTSSVNSSTDVLHEFAEFQTQFPPDDPNSSSFSFFDSVGRESCLSYSSSPPCFRIENLSLYPSGMNRSHPLPVPQIGDNVIGGIGTIKTEESDPNWDYCNEAFGSSSCFSLKEFNFYMMQRDSIIINGRQDFGNLCTISEGWIDSPGGGFDGFFGGQIRRACSAGDLLGTRARVQSPLAFSSPTAGETWLATQEPNAKAVRCSGEERKEKILRYRAKRNRRNFNKTIKYACRKTLADNRLRVRGRFARNDEVCIPWKTRFAANYNGEDYHWVETDDDPEFGFHGGVDGGRRNVNFRYYKE